MKYVSKSIGVPVDQAREMNESLRERRVPGEYTLENKVINGKYVLAGAFVTDERRARAAEFKHRGVIDRDAGYSDHAGS